MAPDEVTPEVTEQETPVAAPEGTPAEQSESVNYEQRYNDLRPQWDRTNQENQQLREQTQQHELAVQYLLSDDPALQAQAREYFGLEDEVEESDEDPKYRELSERQERLEQAEQERQRQQEIEGLEAHINEEIDRVAKESGQKLGKAAREQVFVTALGLDPDESGNPQIEAAFKKVTGELRQEIIDGYIESKKAPRITPPGQSGTEKVNLSNDEERKAHMRAIYEAHTAD